MPFAQQTECPKLFLVDRQFLELQKVLHQQLVPKSLIKLWYRQQRVLMKLTKFRYYHLAILRMVLIVLLHQHLKLMSNHHQHFQVLIPIRQLRRINYLLHLRVVYNYYPEYLFNSIRLNSMQSHQKHSLTIQSMLFIIIYQDRYLYQLFQHCMESHLKQKNLR